MVLFMQPNPSDVLDHVWIVFCLATVVFLLGGGLEVHNVSRSPAVRRYFLLALLSAILAIAFRFIPVLHR
jgi:hypothetical protein